MKLKLLTPAWLRDLAGAWTFYTVLPSLPWPKPSFKRIARFAPLIGLVIGGLQACLWFALASFGWSSQSLTFLVLAFGYWITGGLHLDGLMDTADGLAAGDEKCLEAMQDSRVGAIGVQALIICFALQIAALLKLEYLAPIALPITNFWGRCAPLWAIEHFSYLRETGSGAFHKINKKGLHEMKPIFLILIVIIIALQFIPILWLSKFQLTVGIVLGFLPAILVPHFLGIRLKGHTGDSYGASSVLTETFMLLLLTILWSAN